MSPSETPRGESQDSERPLRARSKKVRETSGVEDETLLEEWERRAKKGELITEHDLEERIRTIEKNAESMQYGSGLERSMYYAVLERMRLRLQMKHGRIDTSDPMDKRDLEILKDLDRRITYAQYEESAVDDILDTVEKYEVYREKYDLDRPEQDGGVPRDAVLEGELQKQLDELQDLMPLMGTVRQIRFYLFRLSTAKESPDIRSKIEELQQKLPPEARTKDITEYYNELDQKLRNVLGKTSAEKTDRPVALVHELYSKSLERHFDSILESRKKLVGSTGIEAEERKNALAKEHETLLSDALSYNLSSYNYRTALLSLLVRESHFGNPEQEYRNELPEKDYGTLTEKDREMLTRKRDQQIQSLEQYVDNFEQSVLRKDKKIDLPVLRNVPLDPTLLFEDLMTNHIIPLKLKLAEPIARGSTILWAPQDAMMESVGLHWDIREKRTQAILRPIYERLGLPANYSELSDEEKKAALQSPVVQERIRSVKEIITEFEQKNMSALHGIKQDVGTIRNLIALRPPESLVLTSEPVLPKGEPNLASLRTDEEFAGAYIYLLERLSGERTEALESAQRQFIEKINTNLNLNIDVSDIETQLSKAWIREWSYAIATYLGEGVAGYLLVRRGIPYAIRKSPAVLRGGARLTAKGLQKGAELTEKGVEAGKKMLRKPSVPKTPGAGAASEGAAAEKAAEGAARSSKIGRVLGPLAIVLTAIDLRRVMLRDARLQELQEIDGVNAAIELLEKHGNTKAFRLREEIGYLRKRLDAAVVLDGSEKVLHEIEKRFPTSEAHPAAEALKSRAEVLMKSARTFKEHYTKLFPVTDYLMTDPAREPGNVGVNIRNIDEARARGMQYEKERENLSDLGKLSEFFQKKEKPQASPKTVLKPEDAEKMLQELLKNQPKDDFTAFKEQYEELLYDAAVLLENE